MKFVPKTDLAKRLWTLREEGAKAQAERLDETMREIPVGAMRVAPGTDAVVWRICPDHSGEL